MKKKATALILTLSFVIGSVFISHADNVDVHAQELEFDQSGLAIGQTSVLYDNSIGMPTSEANAIAQTSDGFIYIGSYSGLIRYDGKEFDRFENRGISSVISLKVDSRDRLWVGTNDTGLAYMEKGEFYFYGKDEGLKSLSVKAVEEDGNGNIIVATTQGVAYVDPEGTMHVLEDERIDGAYVCELRADKRGYVYGETIDGSFFIIEDLKVTHFMTDEDLDSGEVVNCICPDDENVGYVYLGTEGSNIIHGNLDEDMKEYEIIDTPEQNHINMVKMVGSSLWICADDGIAHIEKDGTYSKLTQVDMDNSVDGMLEDYEGNLWFTSSRQGVMKITASIFTNVSRVADLEPRVVNTTCIHNGKLYVGTDTGLVILDEDYQIVELSEEEEELLGTVRIRKICEDSKGNMWFCTYSDSGLVCLHPDGTYTHLNMDNGLASNRVRLVTELSDGSILASVSGGLHLIKDGQVAQTYDHSKGLSNSEILTICQSGETIYLGSDGDGIYTMINGKIEPLETDGLKSDVILRMKQDPYRDMIWIITSNSLAYMKDGKITTVDKFPYSNNFDIFFTEAGNAWVLSSGGIYVVDVEDLIANEDIEYIHYGGESGLPYVTTANSRNCMLENGDLYIAGTNGVTKVNIFDKYTSTENIRLIIPYVDVDGKTIYLDEGETIYLDSDVKRLTIHGFALSYSLNNPTIDYMLEGFDEDISSVKKTDMSAVTYTNLRGGTYTFRMAAVDTLTGEEGSAHTLTIVKKKAFYEHWWIWLVLTGIIVALFALIMFIYFRRKEKALEKKRQQDRQLVREIANVLANVINVKDNYTNGHSTRVAKYTLMLAEKMGFTGEELDDIHNTALLHDIGKIMIPDEILKKQGGLTDDEYMVMRSHAEKGYDILKDIKVAPGIAEGAGYHHERLDGKGYPNGLKGDEIPMIAQIIAVADTFDAMYSTRPYRKKMELSVVIDKIKEVAGTQLNPEVVEKLTELYHEGKLEDDTVE